MPDKFRNKYRISSSRLQHWDYGSNAAYFVTICTQGRKHYFGDIVNGEMQLSAIGKIVQTEWLKTFDLPRWCAIPSRSNLNLTMGEYIVMPNHFHAIIIIGKNQYNNGGDDGGNKNGCHDNVETQCIASLPQSPQTLPPPANQFGPQRKNLASIIRGFKIGVTKRARKINPGFAWQSRYHEHIIRNNTSFKRICNYIISNPANWDADRYKTDK